MSETQSKVTPKGKTQKKTKKCLHRPSEHVNYAVLTLSSVVNLHKGRNLK